MDLRMSVRKSLNEMQLCVKDTKSQEKCLEKNQKSRKYLVKSLKGMKLCRKEH